ncbi:MAG: chromosomal replication initiator protein DnaA, partial [Lachnospiraceae bacterium]|nr:chromosomal replication initiator protein DnaA [Lachnospiraceae bacterium]
MPKIDTNDINWEAIKESVKKEHDLTKISYETWILPLKLYKIEGETVVILVPSDQSQSVSYITNKYSLPFKVAISESLGKTYNVRFILEKDIKQLNNQKNIENTVKYENANLNSKYTFDTFVVGENNRFAHSASLAVAESPGQVYNPLFLYGGVGLGKTHLMHSIAHFIIDNDPEAKVLYVTSESFTNEVIEAIRIGKDTAAAMKKFRDKYRNVDVLLIDDIQFIIGKESTQEEFFHTFNHLHEEKKQIIISSDKPPKDMDILEDRYKSRFEWGLIADIQSPNYETRMAILKNKLDMKGYKISENIIQYIAENITTNIRNLEGAINKIIAYSRLENREIDMDLAEKALKDVISPNEDVPLTPEYILDVVCDHFNITKEEILSTKRESEIVTARQIIMYLCNKYTNYPSTKIGSILKKDHSTILHGVKKIEDYIKGNEEDIIKSIDILKRKLNI